MQQDHRSAHAARPTAGFWSFEYKNAPFQAANEFFAASVGAQRSLFHSPLQANLQPFAETVNYNFMRWTLKRNAGAVHFSEEQMEWLRLIKDHIAVSLSIEPEDLDLNPFDRRGGLGRFYEVFGAQYKEILAEMNIELVA